MDLETITAIEDNAREARRQDARWLKGSELLELCALARKGLNREVPLLERRGVRQAFEDAQARQVLIKHLLKTRAALGISRREVARRMNVKRSVVVRLEGGDIDPRLSLLQRYARALSCKIDAHLVSVAEVRTDE